MVWAPVFRGTPPVPLFIERDSVIAPAWSEDPCDESCCEAGITDCCDGTMPEQISVTFSGISDGEFCETCETLNDTYVLDYLSNCCWEYVENPATFCGLTVKLRVQVCIYQIDGDNYFDAFISITNTAGTLPIYGVVSALAHSLGSSGDCPESPIVHTAAGSDGGSVDYCNLTGLSISVSW